VCIFGEAVNSVNISVTTVIPLEYRMFSNICSIKFLNQVLSSVKMKVS